MNATCFALLLSQSTSTGSLPPAHIQELLKNRVLFQLKQGSPDLLFYFDDPTCTVVGNYDYIQESFEMYSADRSLDLKIPYSDLLEGKAVELSSVKQMIETKQNVILAATAVDDGRSDGGFKFKKWLPWIVGAVGLGIGGALLYNSMSRDGGSGPSQPARRFR